MIYEFIAIVWIYSGQGAWYFVTLPLDIAADISEVSLPSSRGFGSVRVSATIGKTVWLTSLFKDSKSKSYILPVKKDVRVAENISDGKQLTVSIRIL